MKHLDLFSGIGGFALACDWVEESEHIFCENNPFCQKVLTKHWPNSPLYGDIRELKANNFGRIDLLTGGFPCQPFSQAGKQRAENDDRFLWPEMLRIIKESKPTWIIGENVTGIVELALEQVCFSLESEGYEVQPFIIPACATNAPHRRDRVWIVAHTVLQRPSRRESTADEQNQPIDQGNSKEVEPKRCFKRAIWDQWENCLPSPRICRSDDGIPNQSHRIKSLGNAIVPQVAYEIIKLTLCKELSKSLK